MAKVKIELWSRLKAQVSGVRKMDRHEHRGGCHCGNLRWTRYVRRLAACLLHLRTDVDSATTTHQEVRSFSAETVAEDDLTICQHETQLALCGH